MKNILKYLILISLIPNIFLGKSVSCEFEEVYQNGDTQFGKILFHNNLLRYQYDDPQLYTIIYNKNYFLIRNNDQNIINKIKDEKLLKIINSIISDYPSIKETYSDNDIKIFLEFSKNIDFIKRISILNDTTNLSIYFIDCSFEKLSNKYFQPFNLIKIKK